MEGIVSGYTLWLAGVLVAASVLGTLRFLVGPTNLDRLAAFEATALVGLCLVAIYAAARGSAWGFDLILVLSLVGFLTTVAIACFIEGEHGDD